MRIFKPTSTSGRQTVTPFTRKEVDDIRLLCKQRRDRANNSKAKKTVNPHWSDKYLWDRNYMLIDLGVNTALRIEDLVQIRVNDQIKRGYVDTFEFKTGRNKPFQLNPRITRELNDFIQRNHLITGEYLFTSRTGFNKPMTRQQSHSMIRGLADELGIVRKIGCHSLRKTFGKLYYESTNDLVGLHRMLHSGKGDPTVTLIYIGMVDDEISKKRKGFDI